MKVGFYSLLTADEKQALQGLLTTRRLPRGAALFRQGNLPEEFFLILAGSVKLVQSSSQSRDVIMELLFPGDFCGALCTAECIPYTLSAICLEDVEAGFVLRARFHEAALRHPGLLLKATAICREKMQMQREMVVGLAVESADQRAARVLLSLAARLGQMRPGGLRLRIPLDRQGFAEMIGTTTETAIRIFSRFRRKGYLRESADGTMTLSDLESLQALAQTDSTEWQEQFRRSRVSFR
jgi:CRP/FNR family transcriptional regulator